jgi:hypothetical protein
MVARTPTPRLTWQDWVARTNETHEDAPLLLEWMSAALMDARTLARALDLLGIPAPQALRLPPRADGSDGR